MSSGETQPLLASTERGGRKEQTKAAHEKHAQAFGKQTITTAGSFVLNINNLIGPALVTFPLVYKNGTRSGWWRAIFFHYLPFALLSPRRHSKHTKLLGKFTIIHFHSFRKDRDFALNFSVDAPAARSTTLPPAYLWLLLPFPSPLPRYHYPLHSRHNEEGKSCEWRKFGRLRRLLLLFALFPS